MIGMSPDALLSYCQMQLGTLDDAVDQQMTLQKVELERRSAAQSVQTALESFGSQGPSNGQDMQKCVDAFNAAIDKLPPGDTVGNELTNQLNKMCSDYGFRAGHWQTPVVTTGPVAAQSALLASRSSGPPDAGPSGQSGGFAGLLYGQGPTPAGGAGAHSPAGPEVASAPAGPEARTPQPVWVPPTIDKPPKNDEWKATTDAVGNVSDNIKTDAEIGMLQLQDLVSQRQQAVSLVTGMMSKEDQTLEDGAKAIGR
jgi:hypothetical protein